MRTRSLILFLGVILWGLQSNVRPSIAFEISEESVLNGPGSATHPAVSPNGKTMAFMSNAAGVVIDRGINFEIYTLEIDSGLETRLTFNNDFDADISFSPDGSKIAYKSYRDQNDEIYLMNLDGSNQRNISNHPADDHQPHWAPDGKSLVFNSKRTGSSDIFILNLEDEVTTALTTTSFNDSSPRWSPDGSLIAFVSNREGTDDIFVMDRDGTNVRLIAQTPASDWSPRWNPDGKSLLFISGDFSRDQFALYSVNVSEHGEPTIVVDRVDSGNPAWHPNGERIYFGRYDDDVESRLFSANPDGSDIKPIAH